MAVITFRSPSPWAYAFLVLGLIWGGWFLIPSTQMTRVTSAEASLKQWTETWTQPNEMVSDNNLIPHDSVSPLHSTNANLGESDSDAEEEDEFIIDKSQKANFDDEEDEIDDDDQILLQTPPAGQKGEDENIKSSGSSSQLAQDLNEEEEEEEEKGEDNEEEEEDPLNGDALLATRKGTQGEVPADSVLERRSRMERRGNPLARRYGF